jgi:hypothetical protein
MAIKFPSFDPGTPGTLLDSENAQKVKTFIECWNNATVVIGGENKVSISESNVVISLNRADLGGSSSALTQTEFNAMLLTALGSPGDEQDAILDIVLAYFGQTPVGTCDPGGTITVLTVP